MMEIILSEDYRIGSDKLQYMLQERKTVKEGKTKGNEYWESIGYFRTVEQVLQAYIELRVRTSEAKTIGELIETVSLLKQEVKKTITI